MTDKLDEILMDFRSDTVDADKGCNLPDIGLVKTKVLDYFKENARVDKAKLRLFLKENSNYVGYCISKGFYGGLADAIIKEIRL